MGAKQKGRFFGFTFVKRKEPSLSFARRPTCLMGFGVMKLEFTEDSEKLEKLFQGIKTLGTTEVEVGLPASAGGQLAFILGVQEHGSPVMRIPPRPVIGPGLAQEDVRAEMAEGLRQAAEAALDGDEDGIAAGFEAAGKAGADGIRAYIDAGVAPPNSPVTVSGGWIWNRVAKKGVPVEGKGFNKPLYRTGELYGAFDYEVKRR